MFIVEFTEKWENGQREEKWRKKKISDSSAEFQIYIYRYDKHTVYTGTQIQMAFLAFCFHHRFERIHRSISVRRANSYRIKPFSFFVGIFLFGFVGLFFLSTSLAWWRACVYCSFFYSIWIYVWEWSRYYADVWMCLSPCSCEWVCAKRRKYIDSIMGFFKRNCNKKQEWEKEWNYKKN